MGCCHANENLKKESKLEIIDEDANPTYKSFLLLPTNPTFITNENEFIITEKTKSKAVSFDLNDSKFKIKNDIQGGLKFNPAKIKVSRKNSKNSKNSQNSKNSSLPSSPKKESSQKKINFKLKLKEENTKAERSSTKVNSYIATNNLFCIKSADDSVHHPNRGISFNEIKINEQSEYEDQIGIEKFDCYNYAKDVFNSINDIRISPSIYEDLLDSIIAKVSSDGDLDYIQSADLPYKSIFNGKYMFKNKKKGLISLSSFLRSLKDKSFEPILWSEKIYNKCCLNIINLNSLKIDYSEDDNDNSIEQLYYSKTNIKLKSSIQATLEGGFSPETSALFILSEATNNLRDALITENFDLGSVAFSLDESEYSKGILLLIFGNKKQKEDRLLESHNTNITNEIDLDNSIFDMITYKNDIVSGEFQIENQILTAKFVLENGTNRTERLIMKS